MGAGAYDPQGVNSFLETYSPEVRQTALKLRRLVLEAVPDAIEQVDRTARLIGYGFARTYRDTVCVIIPHKTGVNLGFPRGVELPDPEGLLEGEGIKTRHVKITGVMVAKPAVRALIAESAYLVRA
jgi:hypothetical protein